MLALGVSCRPHLIVMDEPTNHLDLPSIEYLEAALDGCVCGLLLVSHDVYFLRRLCRTRWEARPEGDRDGVQQSVLHVWGNWVAPPVN